jgi:hypothetical protein
VRRHEVLLTRRTLGAVSERLASSAVAIAVILSNACVAPRIREDTPAACSNGIDDDDDGAVDCEDSSCVASDACEVSAASCRDGVDNDRDGLVDCEAPSCVRAGHCTSYAAPCDSVLQTGCTRGLACFPEGSYAAPERVCALPGGSGEGDPCEVHAGDPSGGCAAGLLCPGLGLCARPCGSIEECPRGSLCLVARAGEGALGACSLTCLPLLGCAEGYSCVAAQRLGVPYAAGGYMHACFSTRVVDKAAPPGTASIGEPCVDAALQTSPPERVCRPDTLCVPTPDGGACRELCIGNASGEASRACAHGRCVVVDPFDQRPPRPSEPFRYGVCIE